MEGSFILDDITIIVLFWMMFHVTLDDPVIPKLNKNYMLLTKRENENQLLQAKMYTVISSHSIISFTGQMKKLLLIIICR